MNKKYISKEGLEQLKEELKEMKEVKRPQIIERIQVAKEQGDLSENAEYHEARDAQSFSEGRILELENTIRNALVMEDHVGQKGVVNIGSKVTVDCNGQKIQYHIVGSNEADPSSGKISNESPIGSAFLGKKKGESLTIIIPSGAMECTIKGID